MTRQFAASRMTVLLGAALAWLAIGFDARSLAAEEPQPGNATLAPADRVEQVLNGDAVGPALGQKHREPGVYLQQLFGKRRERRRGNGAR